jgi:hypothetical protein
MIIQEKKDSASKKLGWDDEEEAAVLAANATV